MIVASGPMRVVIWAPLRRCSAVKCGNPSYGRYFPQESYWTEQDAEQDAEQRAAAGRSGG